MNDTNTNTNTPNDIVGTGRSGWPRVLHVAACTLARQMASGHSKRGEDQRTDRYEARIDASTAWDAVADTYVRHADRLFAHPTRSYQPTADASRLLVGMSKQTLRRLERGERDVATGKDRPRCNRRDEEGNTVQVYAAHVDADVALADHEARGEAIGADYDVADATARAIDRLPAALQPTARHMLLSGGSADVPEGVASKTWYRRVADVRQALKRILPECGLAVTERTEKRTRDQRATARPLVPINGNLEPVALGRG